MSGRTDKLKAPCRAFVFNSAGNQWIERGTGVLRVFQNGDSRVVVEMRQEKTSKMLVSFQVEPKTQLEPSADSTTAWVFKVRGHRVGGDKPRDEVLALQFGTTAIAKEFQSMHSWGQQVNAEAAAREAESAMASQQPSSVKPRPQRRLTIDGAKAGGVDLESLAGAMDDLGLDDEGNATAPSSSGGGGGGGSAKSSKPVNPTHGVVGHKGVSKKGYAADPRMKPYNQDRLVQEQDPKTGAWCFCVFDGHGEVGR